MINNGITRCTCAGFKFLTASIFQIWILALKTTQSNRDFFFRKCAIHIIDTATTAVFSDVYLKKHAREFSLLIASPRQFLVGIKNKIAKITANYFAK